MIMTALALGGRIDGREYSSMRTNLSSFPSLCLTAVVACFGSAGCIIPFPHTQTTWGPITGRIEDAASYAPISAALVQAHYADGGQLKAATQTDGAWRLPAKQRFCWGILFGVALNHSLPQDDCQLERRVRLTVSAPSYRPAHLDLDARPPGSPPPPGDQPDPPPPHWPAEPAGPDGAWRLPPIRLTASQ